MDGFFHGGYDIDEGEAVLWDEDAEDDGRSVFVSGEFIQDFPWDHATRYITQTFWPISKQITKPKPGF